MLIREHANQIAFLSKSLLFSKYTHKVIFVGASQYFVLLLKNKRLFYYRMCKQNLTLMIKFFHNKM